MHEKFCILILALLGSSAVFAQDSEATNDSDEMSDPATLENSHPQASGLNLLRIMGPPGKRLFGVVPNYRADQFQQDYTPISTHDKYTIARKDSFDWPNFPLIAGYALQAQVAAHGFSHNGGLSTFGKFYARGIGDQIIGSYITEAILPSMLHEDPRFFRIGTGSICRRASHAAMSILVTRRDDGRYGFNIAEVAGNAGVVALTTLYYPDNRSVGDASARYGMQLGNDIISNLLTEFWPDMKRHLPFHAK